jgi:mono/diheme cytochrome c family protein
MKRKIILIIFKLIFFVWSYQAILCLGQTDSTNIYNKGRSLFHTNCSQCHSVHREIIGPMLASIPKKKSEAWLQKFIKNSQQVIVSGDPYAIFLYEQYNQQVMPSFRLSNEEINNILYYIEKESSFPSEAFYNDDDDVRQQSNETVIKGKQLFNQQCYPCHALQKETDYGPALGSITKRHPRSWLIPFIKNSQQVIQSRDVYAVHLFNSFSQRVMVSMEFLEEEDIDAILDYIEFASESHHAEAGVNGRSTEENNQRLIAFAHQAAPAGPKEGTPILKILVIIFGLAGVSVHTYLIIKLLKFLQKETVDN